MSRLTKVEVENVKRIRVLKFEPKRGVNIAESHPPDVIRLGEEKARVMGETEEYIGTRRWWRTAEGIKTELKVVSKVDGSVIKGPQTLYDKIYPAESDPTAFFRMKGPERREWLMKVVGVDPTLLDRKIDQVFKARTLVNHDLDAARARLNAMLADKPPAPIDTAALLKERGELVAAQQLGARVIAERNAATRRITDCEGAVETAKQALAQAQTRLELARKQYAEADNAVDEAETLVAGVPERITQLDEQLQKASAVATANARWTERLKLVDDVAKLALDSEGKTLALEKLRGEKVALIANANFPVPGLGFAENDVTLNGLPLEQASGAQRIRVGAAVLTARNPKLRILRVPSGGDLDEDNLAALVAFCDENDMQCFVEIPGESGPATLLIRDGEAVEL